jgi:hypothetical protein
MCLNKATGVMDIATLWDRKKTIVSQQKGLTYRAVRCCDGVAFHSSNCPKIR